MSENNTHCLLMSYVTLLLNENNLVFQIKYEVFLSCVYVYKHIHDIIIVL